MSYNGTDNGYAVFNHVRIPRTNLLMRHSKVSRDGTYTTVPLRQKLVYGGMLNGRSISKYLEQSVSFVHSSTETL
jgi:acyl-CoA oxidase